MDLDCGMCRWGTPFSSAMQRCFTDVYVLFKRKQTWEESKQLSKKEEAEDEKGLEKDHPSFQFGTVSVESRMCRALNLDDFVMSLPKQQLCNRKIMRFRNPDNIQLIPLFFFFFTFGNCMFLLFLLVADSDCCFPPTITVKYGWIDMCVNEGIYKGPRLALNH